jgi:hypothetical protein
MPEARRTQHTTFESGFGAGRVVRVTSGGRLEWVEPTTSATQSDTSEERATADATQGALVVSALSKR